MPNNLFKVICLSWLFLLLLTTKGYSQTYFDIFNNSVTRENASSKKNFVDSLIILSKKQKTKKTLAKLQAVMHYYSIVLKT